MNINKLVRMAQIGRTYPVLAQLSTQWAEQTKLGNPVANARSLYHHRLKVVWLICFLFISPFAWLGLSSFFNYPSVGGVLCAGTWIVTVGFLIDLFSKRTAEQKDYHLRHHSALQFARAITLLEERKGSDMDRWDSNMGFITELSTTGQMTLEKMAGNVKYAQSCEKRDYETHPWNKPSKKKSEAMKAEFESAFELLTTLLSIPKDRRVYYGDSIPIRPPPPLPPPPQVR